MIRAESFDVFDSALVRDVLAPSEVFLRVGERLLRDFPDTTLSAVEFGRLRVLAETRARAALDYEDVTLDEIWTELASMLGWDWNDRLPEAELAEEAACLAPVEKTRQQIASARERHGRVLFVSDSYLPRHFLHRQLERFGLMADGDRLYISSEARLTKSSGSLFAHILHSERLAARELRHHGDNLQSDVRVPRAMGIRATRLAVPDLTRNEQALLDRPFSAVRSLRDIVGASRQFRALAPPDGQSEGTMEAAGAFLGPFCGLLAGWALDSARARGLRRLYFCARDCQLVWKAARILAPRYGDIDCRYLYVSRQSLFLASVTAVDRRQLHWLRRPFEQPLLERVLAKIEIDPHEWGSALRDIGKPGPEGIVLREESDWGRFWDAVESPPLRDAIAAKANERRTAVLAYFRSVGMLDFPLVGIVDIGWHLTCQASLRKILRTADQAPREVCGYYLQLNGDRLPPCESGPAEFLFSEPASDVERFGRDLALHHMDAFLEHVAGQATHPSTASYAKNGHGEWEPVFLAPAGPVEDFAAIERHHHAVEQYVRRYGHRVAEWARDRSLLPLVIHRVSDVFFRSASDAAVGSLRHVLVSIDQNSLDLHPLMRPISWWDAVRPIVPAAALKQSHRDPYHPWPHARRLITSHIKNAAFLVASRAARVRSWLWRSLGPSS